MLQIYNLLKKRIVEAVVILNYKCKASWPRCYQKSFSESVSSRMCELCNRDVMNLINNCFIILKNQILAKHKHVKP